VYLHIHVLLANWASCLAEVLVVAVEIQMSLQVVVDNHLRGAAGSLRENNLQGDIDMT